MNILCLDYLLFELISYIRYNDYISLLLVCSGSYNYIKKLINNINKLEIYKQLGERLINNGCIIFGGYVRDMINGECPKDIDLIVPKYLRKTLFKKIKKECLKLNKYARQQIFISNRYYRTRDVSGRSNTIIFIMMRYISEGLFENDNISNEEIYNRINSVFINIKYLSSILKDILGDFLNVDVIDVSMYDFPDIMFKYVVFFNGIYINLDVKYTWTIRTTDFKCNNLYTFMRNKKIITKPIIDTFSVDECVYDIKNKLAHKVIDGRKYDLGARLIDVKLYERFEKMKNKFPNCEKVHINETKGYEIVSRIKKMLDRKFTVVGLPTETTSNDIVPRESCYKHCNCQTNV